MTFYDELLNRMRQQGTSQAYSATGVSPLPQPTTGVQPAFPRLPKPQPQLPGVPAIGATPNIGAPVIQPPTVTPGGVGLKPYQQSVNLPTFDAYGRTSGGGGPNIGAPPPPARGGGPLQEFGPGNDLRSTQINPFTGERLQGVQQGTDVMFRSLAQGPSLSQAALDSYKLFGEEQGDERRRGIRSIGQAAARLGRLGSGMVTTDLGNLEERLGIADARERGRLASGLAFSEGAERRANLGAGQAFEGQLYGQGRGLRDEARGERGFQEDQARNAFEQEIMRRQLQQNHEQMLRQLGLQGAELYGNQAAAGQQSAADLIAGAF